MAVGDTPARLRSSRFEVHLTVLIPTSQAIFQFGVQSLEGTRQLVPTAVVDMRAPLRLA